MAEGWARRLLGDRFRVYSAGIEAHGLNPLAVRAMADAGLDISGQRSQRLDELEVADFDYVVSVCDNARERCPVFPARVKRLHHSFDDPPALAAGCADEEEALVHYRRVRDQIRDWIASLPERLG